MIRSHRYTEPQFTMTEAADICRVEYTALSEWIGRGLVQVGQKPPGMRRTLYSVADLVTIAVVSDLNRIISMRPGFSSGAFIDKAKARLAEVARNGFDKLGRHFLIGWQRGPDTFSVKPLIKMRGVDWAEFEHPVVIVPIDAIIERVINEADKRIDDPDEDTMREAAQ